MLPCLHAFSNSLCDDPRNETILGIIHQFLSSTIDLHHVFSRS